MPGVNVTLTSPAMQVGKVTVVTESDGNYRFVNCRRARIGISFELSGFKTVVVNDLQLTIGFVARTDATIAIGGLEETVTVTRCEPGGGPDHHDHRVNLTRARRSTRCRWARVCSNCLLVTPASRPTRWMWATARWAFVASTTNYGFNANSKIQTTGSTFPTDEYRHLHVEYDARRSPDQNIGQRRRSFGAGCVDGGGDQIRSNQFHGTYQAEGGSGLNCKATT
jgi:hypothetical protein